MELEWPPGVSDEPTEELIRALLPEVDYLILSQSKTTYIQCGYRTGPPWGLVLEYQDGSLAQHFRGALGPYDEETCIRALVKYLRGDPSWHGDIRVWEHLDMPKVMRQEVRERREVERFARRAALRTRMASKRTRPTRRRGRLATWRPAGGSDGARIPDGDLTTHGANRSSRSAIWVNVRRVISAVRRGIARLFRRQPSGT